MIIVLGISEQEDFHRPEIPLEKTREIDNEARISKKAEMKRKFNRNQKRITPWDIQLSSLIFLQTYSEIFKSALKYYPFHTILFGLGWVERVRVYPNSHFLKRDFGILIKINYWSKSTTVTRYSEFQTLSTNEKIYILLTGIRDLRSKLTVFQYAST